MNFYIQLDTGMDAVQNGYKIFDFALTMYAHYLLKLKSAQTTDCFLWCILSKQLIITFTESRSIQFVFKNDFPVC